MNKKTGIGTARLKYRTFLKNEIIYIFMTLPTAIKGFKYFLTSMCISMFKLPTNLHRRRRSNRQIAC